MTLFIIFELFFDNAVYPILVGFGHFEDSLFDLQVGVVVFELLFGVY